MKEIVRIERLQKKFALFRLKMNEK